MTDAPDPRPVAAFDLDGTLFREHLLFMLFKTFFELEVFSKATRAAFEDLARDYRDRKIPHSQYNAALVGLFDGNISGIDLRDVRSAAKRASRYYHDWVYTFTRALFDAVGPTHQRITITGAVKEVVEELLPHWPFDAVYATELEIRKGSFTGRRKRLCVDKKYDVVQEHFLLTRAPVSGSIAVGDTESDAAMLAAVERPIAFNPNDALATAAEKNGWPMVIERKDCIHVVDNGTYHRFSIHDAEAAVRFVLSLKGPSCG